MSKPTTNPRSGSSVRRWFSAQRSVTRAPSWRNYSFLLLMVLLAEVGVGIFVLKDLRQSYVQVQKMYEGSVRGLRRIGELQYEAQETRRSTLYALTTNDGNLQVNYADQSREADRLVTQGVADYVAQAQLAHDQAVLAQALTFAAHRSRFRSSETTFVSSRKPFTMSLCAACASACERSGRRRRLASCE